MCVASLVLSKLSLDTLDDMSFQLSKYLLRTLCSDLTNMVVVYLAEDCGVATPPAENMAPNVS